MKKMFTVAAFISLLFIGCGSSAGGSGGSGGGGGGNPTPTPNADISGQWDGSISPAGTGGTAEATFFANIQNQGNGSFFSGPSDTLFCTNNDIEGCFDASIPLKLCLETYPTSNGVGQYSCQYEQFTSTATTVGNQVTLNLVTTNAGGTFTATCTGTVSGKTMSGTCTYPFGGPTNPSWSAVQVSLPANPNVLDVYTGTLRSTTYPSPIPISLSFSDQGGPGVCCNLSGSATTTNEPCGTGWTFQVGDNDGIGSNYSIGGAFVLVSSNAGAIFIAAPNLLNTGAPDPARSTYALLYQIANGCADAGEADPLTLQQ